VFHGQSGAITAPSRDIFADDVSGISRIRNGRTVAADLLSSSDLAPGDLPGSFLSGAPAEPIEWECRSHGCSDPERHGRVDDSARVATGSTNHTRSSRRPMRGMPPAHVSLRVRGRADVISVRGSSQTAIQPGSICQGLRPGMLAPTVIIRRTLPIWPGFLLRVPLDYVRCPFPG
jgi:hypothetical protein